MIIIAAIQISFSKNLNDNYNKIDHYLKIAAKKNCDFIVLPELHDGHYFCKNQNSVNFKLAFPIEKHPTIAFIKKKAKQYRLAICASIFENDNSCHYNSIVVIDKLGQNIHHYRKNHIPDGIGYQEKYYFKPGNTAPQIFTINNVKIGSGICWDQWFPENARINAIKGADICFYPTAIGFEPVSKEDTCSHWQRVIQGQAGANIMPIIVANRVGKEGNQEFYGSSFMTDHFGKIIKLASKDQEEILIGQYNEKIIRSTRAEWGFFRDRRVDNYQALLQ